MEGVYVVDTLLVPISCSAPMMEGSIFSFNGDLLVGISQSEPMMPFLFGFAFVKDLPLLGASILLSFLIVGL